MALSKHQKSSKLYEKISLFNFSINVKLYISTQPKIHAPKFSFSLFTNSSRQICHSKFINFSNAKPGRTWIHSRCDMREIFCCFIITFIHNRYKDWLPELEKMFFEEEKGRKTKSKCDFWRIFCSFLFTCKDSRIQGVKAKNFFILLKIKRERSFCSDEGVESENFEL